MFLGAKILCFKNIIFRIVLSGDTKGAAPRLEINIDISIIIIIVKLSNKNYWIIKVIKIQNKFQNRNFIFSL